MAARQPFLTVRVLVATAALAAAGVSAQVGTPTARVESRERMPPPTIFVEFYAGAGVSEKNSHFPRTGLEVPGAYGGLDPKWWDQELDYVVQGGIDVINLMSWEGSDVSRRHSSFRVMLEVMDERKKAGKKNPKVAFHFDGMGFGRLRGLTLDEQEGMRAVYEGIPRFYGIFIDSGHEDVLFRIDGRFPVFIYHPEPTGGITALKNRLVPYIKKRFREEMGGREVYLLFEELWRNGFYSNNKLAVTNADNYYNWGASYTGMKTPPFGDNFDVSTIGPGFDDKGHNQADINPEAGKRFRSREGGKVFREEWDRAIQRRDRAPWLILETWNLFMEGSEITPSRKYGDLYLRICSEKALLFKADPQTIRPIPDRTAP